MSKQAEWLRGSGRIKVENLDEEVGYYIAQTVRLRVILSVKISDVTHR